MARHDRLAVLGGCGSGVNNQPIISAENGNTNVLLLEVAITFAEGSSGIPAEKAQLNEHLACAWSSEGKQSWHAAPWLASMAITPPAIAA